MVMNVNDYRDDVQSRLEEITISNERQRSDLYHIKEVVIEIKELVKEQNGRVRKNTNKIWWIYGLISSFGVIATLIRIT